MHHRLFAFVSKAADECRHYFVKEGGQWVCTMCGASR